MIEVLVTILILSFGMLGIAGMMLRSIESGAISTSRSIAAWQANEMADRMRANLAGLRAGNYASMSYTAVSACPSACLTAKCSSSDQADFDFCMWNAQNQKVLPLGRGSVEQSPGGACSTSQNFCSFDISVSWDEGKTGDTANLKQYTLRVEP
jgi:type IV pilus assembly protein PilV